MIINTLPNKLEKNDPPFRFKVGFTLLELTVVMVVIMLLIGLFAFGMRGYRDWQKGAEAGTRLRAVYTAQLTYLSEHPTVEVENLAMTDIIPYLASGGGFLTSAIPDPVDLKEVDIFILDLDDGKLQIKVDKSPPYIDGDYDPSANPDDGQWDVGN